MLEEPRYSEDLDLMIAVSGTQSKNLVQALESRFYISKVAVEDAFGGGAALVQSFLKKLSK